MGKQINTVSDASRLGFDALLSDTHHPITEALAQVEGGLVALRRALVDEAQKRAETLAGDVRARVLDAESAVERAISHVPGVGPALAMRLFRATHGAEEAADAGVRPSNTDDASAAQIEPGGVASSAYLAHVGLA